MLLIIWQRPSLCSSFHSVSLEPRKSLNLMEIHYQSTLSSNLALGRQIQLHQKITSLVHLRSKGRLQFSTNCLSNLFFVYLSLKKLRLAVLMGQCSDKFRG